MSATELYRTLVELVGALEPPEGTGLRVDSARLDVPLEVAARPGPDGLTFVARVPHSRWKSGFLPAVHMSRIVVEPADPIERAGAARER